MFCSIDGSSFLPNSFQFFQSTQYFYDLVLAVAHDGSPLQADDPNSTIVSDMMPNAVSSLNETMIQPVLEQGNFTGDQLTQTEDVVINEVPSGLSEVFAVPESLHQTLNSTRWSHLPEGSSLHDSTQSTVNNNSETITSDSAAVTFWERKCHKMLIAQHSALIREILIKAWNEIDKLPIGEGTEILDDSYHAKMQNDGERRFLRLELKDIKINSLESILDCIYTGKLRYEEENFGSLINDARKMGFDIIIHLCEEHLAQSVSIKNWDNLLLCAHYSENEEIVSDCFKFIEGNVSTGQSENTCRIIQTMQRLAYPVLLKLMSSEVVNEQNVETMIKAITSWVDSERESRRNYLHSLISLMASKLHLLSFDFLRNLGGHDIVQQDDATYRLVMNTFLIKQPSSTISASHFSSPSSHSPSCVAPREVTETSTKTSKTTQLSSSAIQTKVKQYKTTPPKEPPSGTPIHPTQIASSTLPTFTSSLQPYPCLSTSSSSPTLSNIPDEETLIVLSNKKDKKGNSVHEMFDCSKSSWSEWITKGNMEWGLEAQVVRKTLVCMGGFGAHGKKVNLYDFSKNWISGPDMNFPRWSFASCVLNDCQILVFGGFSLTPDISCTCEMLQLCRPGSSIKFPLEDWKMLPSMPAKRYGCSAASVNSQVFVLGGTSPEELSVESTVFMFEFKSRKWRQVNSMRERRSHFAIATHDEAIYVFGGLNESYKIQSVERYYPKLDTWEYLTNPPSLLSSCTAGVLGNKILIIGGVDEHGSHTKKTHVYDLQKSSWSRGADITNKLIDPRCVKVQRSLLESPASKKNKLNVEAM